MKLKIKQWFGLHFLQLIDSGILNMTMYIRSYNGLQLLRLWYYVCMYNGNLASTASIVVYRFP